MGRLRGGAHGGLPGSSSQSVACGIGVRSGNC